LEGVSLNIDRGAEIRGFSEHFCQLFVHVSDGRGAVTTIEICLFVYSEHVEIICCII
jgi:hypothetical protein